MYHIINLGKAGEKMSRFCPLFSGSDGNATLISTAYGAFLTDAGASFKALSEAVESRSIDIGDLKFICITHEHSDHIKGLKTLLKRTNIPLVASEKTLETLANADLIPPETKTFIADKGAVSFGEIGIERFATSHDCEGSSGYVFNIADKKRVAVCTDLGIVTDTVENSLLGCDTVLIESNHDIEMLKKGPYPPQLKMRILSDKGHLSNNACASLLPILLKSGTKRFILGHLSRNNNMPTLAISSSRGALADIGAFDGTDYILSAAAPKENGVCVF